MANHLNGIGKDECSELELCHACYLSLTSGAHTYVPSYAKSTNKFSPALS